VPINISRLSPRDEMFTWAPYDGPVLHFAMSRLVRYLRDSGRPPEPVELTEDLVRHCVEKHGVELDHLPSIKRDRLEDPCVLLAWPDGTHIVADGNHRLAMRYMLGMDHFFGWMVPEATWRRFTIDGVPTNKADAIAFVRRFPNFSKWMTQRT